MAGHTPFPVSFFVFLGLVIAWPAAARSQELTAGDLVKDIAIKADRDIGYFVGDLMHVSVEFVVAENTALDRASLPRPGPINYWLDLRSIGFKEERVGEGVRYDLALVYQNFYNALDARQLEIPSFRIVLTQAGKSVPIDIPAWAIGVSPLREVVPPQKDDPKDYLRADRGAPQRSIRPYWTAAAVFIGLAFLALVGLLWRLCWWPFQPRPSQAFIRAAKRVRQLRRERGGDPAYLQALQALHKGIDQTDGTSIFAEDLDLFVTRHPTYLPLKASLAKFFSASRLAFFGTEASGAQIDLPFDAVDDLARQLARIERMGT
ncbi:hypothetical protein BA190_08650 [Labrys sp. WJW]|uniref:hypothetical protein n=1 Tax=Labrys sp. WJW TaxID=1737983 RepID=UPI0008298BC5|nr:hypothetical protein [Labrys sp. WJW]OCC05474.1 hypothetical protein BA190_08650 [Labrys sp. WJW]